MTIQRKYSLPNCTLILEGLSTNTEDGQPQAVRPVLSMLVNAECHFSSAQQPLSGGRDFFESLLTAVSGYAQEFLSHVPHPEAHRQGPGAVQLQKVGDNRHRLSVQPVAAEMELGSDADATLPEAIEVDLTTVQLFDLVEAIDQFFADSQTLPELSLQLTPLSKRYVPARPQLAKQAVPATVGMSGLALAAIAFFFVPVPEVRPPEPKPQSQGSESEELATASPIVNPAQLVELNQKLYNQLKPAWKPQPTIQQDLIYRVGVSADGAIKGYTAVNEVANAQVQQTPLPNLLVKPSPASATPEPLAQYEVVFNPNGEVQVRPWGRLRNKM